MSKIFILLFMVFMHIVDDYYMQGILAKMNNTKFQKKLQRGIFGNFAGANPALCVYNSNTAMHCMEDGTPEDINAISTSTEAVNKKYPPSEWFMGEKKYRN